MAANRKAIELELFRLNAWPMIPPNGPSLIMLATVRIEVVLAVLVVLNLIGMTIAAWRIKYQHDLGNGRKCLERLVREFPQTPQALAAHRRLEQLEKTKSVRDQPGTKNA